MGKRVLGGLFSCAVAIAALSGCATGSLNSPSIVTTGPATSTAVTAVTAAQSAAAASAAEQSRRADLAAASASSRAAVSKEAARLAAASSADAAAESAAEESAAQQASADQPASEATGQPDDATTEEAPSSILSEADALAHGWYDERGWVSPQTAARAVAAGIPVGANVPDSLRCGTVCGEDPTSGEIQAQKSAEQASALASAGPSVEPCAYMVVRGVCYATPSEAAAAGE